MAMMGRLRQVAAGIEWLETEGPFRLAAILIKVQTRKERVVARLAREPGHAEARRLAPYLGIALPPLPKPRPAMPMFYPVPPPAASPSTAEAVAVPAAAPEEAHPEEPREARPPDGYAAGSELPFPQGEVACERPPSIPGTREHSMAGLAFWRQRGPQDVDYWDTDRGGYKCLTEYDPLALGDS